MVDANQKCWICSSSAATGEHKTKKSDLKLIFGSWTQADPLYYHDANKPNQIVRGPESKLLKFPNLICANCNGSLTQPYDRAWEVMSSWFRPRISTLTAGTIIRANRVFPHNTRQNMLNVHLYFVKLFGCSLGETGGQIPIPLDSFADSIKNHRAHPDIYIRFALGPDVVGASNMRIEQTQVKSSQIAGWSYLMDGLQVQVFFAKSVAPISKWVKAAQVWHPRLGTSRLVLGDLP